MKKILIVDDDRDLSELTQSVLKQAGYEVIVSHDSLSGIDMAKKQKPNLILMDVMLPGMNGAEVVKSLKADTILKDIPVIFLTALLSEADKHNTDGIRVDDKKYIAIAKPYEIKNLLEKVKKILG